jgi:hypothetical protein
MDRSDAMIGHTNENRVLADIDVQDRVPRAVPKRVIDQFGGQEEHIFENLVRQSRAGFPHMCSRLGRSERVAMKPGTASTHGTALIPLPTQDGMLRRALERH